MVATNRDLRRRGYSHADIELARKQREAELRSGGSPRSLLAVLAGKSGKSPPGVAPADLTARQLRVRGVYGQAALMVDQKALTERDPLCAIEVRTASGILKKWAGRPAQQEFNFFMANTTTGHQYHDAILERLKATGAPASERRTALAALGLIIRWVGWQTYECQKSAADLADLLDMHKAGMTRTLNLLEKVGAIARVKRGRTKVITVTPEGAYRGDINRHAEAVDRYRAEVVPLRQPTGEPPAVA